MYDWDEWEEFRAEAHKYAREREETLIKNWLKKINYNHEDPIGYNFDTYKKIVEIYSKYPGQLIGRGGKNVEIFESMVEEEFKYKMKVNFIEIRGGFVTIENLKE